MTSVDVVSERDILVERLMRSTAGMFEIFTTYLGVRLGVYRTLADAGPTTSLELAQRTSTQERCIRQWLEQQTVIGMLRVDDPAAARAERRYRLPDGHAEVLVDRESPMYLAPLAQLVVGTVRPLEAVVDAIRSGRGVPFGNYGRDMRESQGGLNRVAFLTQLGQEWIPSIADVQERLQSDPPATVAEVGCGFGCASIGLACAYPEARVDGFDLEGPSIESATTNARTMSVADHVSFAVRDAASAVDAEYDLVLAFECLHDTADPVGALRAVRSLAGKRGAVTSWTSASENHLPRGTKTPSGSCTASVSSTACRRAWPRHHLLRQALLCARRRSVSTRWKRVSRMSALCRLRTSSTLFIGSRSSSTRLSGLTSAQGVLRARMRLRSINSRVRPAARRRRSGCSRDKHKKGHKGHIFGGKPGKPRGITTSPAGNRETERWECLDTLG